MTNKTKQLIYKLKNSIYLATESLLEFAFSRKDLINKLDNQSFPLIEHLIKCQLYHESTSYQTVYDIYNKVLRIKRADKESFINKDLLIKLFFNGPLSNNEDDYLYNVNLIACDNDNNYKQIFNPNFNNFKKAMNLFINYCLDNKVINRYDFYHQFKEILQEVN